jgi:hypothetical protein
MKQTLFAILLCLACGTQTVLAQTQNTKYEKFVGKIGEYDITLFFNPQVTVGNNSGYYFYNDRPKNQFTLILKFYEAKMREDATGMPVAWGHHWILEEYSPAGNHTGTFDGIEMAMGDGFEGTFTNAKGEKFEFKLVQKFEE